MQVERICDSWDAICKEAGGRNIVRTCMLACMHTFSYHPEVTCSDDFGVEAKPSLSGVLTPGAQIRLGRGALPEAHFGDGRAPGKAPQLHQVRSTGGGSKGVGTEAGRGVGIVFVLRVPSGFFNGGHGELLAEVKVWRVREGGRRIKCCPVSVCSIFKVRRHCMPELCEGHDSTPSHPSPTEQRTTASSGRQWTG